MGNFASSVLGIGRPCAAKACEEKLRKIQNLETDDIKLQNKTA